MPLDCFAGSCSRLWFLLRGACTTTPQKTSNWKLMRSLPNSEIYAEALKRLNDLAEYRRLRIFAGNDTVPSVVWLVLLVGSVISISYTYFFGMKNIRAQYLIAASLTVTITMILFLIYVLDHPFTGTSRVSSEPLKQVMQIINNDQRLQPPSIP